MKIAVIDTETGGLNPHEVSLLTVGVGIFTGSDVLKRNTWSIASPIYTVTPKAMEINQLNLSTLADTGVPMHRAAKEIADFVAGVDVYMGHNFIFDVNFLEINGILDNARMMRNHIDTKALALYYMTIGKLPVMNTSLQTLLKYFNIDPGTAHNAADDVLSTYKLYRKLSEL